MCQALRSAGQPAPVLFLTALGAVHERLAGFSAGADDYLPKPFDVLELIARVEVLAKRGRLVVAAGPDRPGPRPARHSVACNGREAMLTPTEFRMLAAITSRPGEVVRRRAVVAAAWPQGRDGQRQHRRLLRAADPRQARARSTRPCKLTTVRGRRLHTEVMGEDGTDEAAAGPLGTASGSRRAPSAARSSPRRSVLMTVAMIVVVLGIHLVLERTAEPRHPAGAGRPVDAPCSRSSSTSADQPWSRRRTRSSRAMVVYDASGRRVAGLGRRRPSASSADDLAAASGRRVPCRRRRGRGPAPRHTVHHAEPVRAACSW